MPKTVEVTLADETADRVHTAFAKQFEADRQDGETDADLTRRKVAEFVKEVTKAHEANEAAETARRDAAEAAAREIVVD